MDYEGFNKPLILEREKDNFPNETSFILSDKTKPFDLNEWDTRQTILDDLFYTYINMCCFIYGMAPSDIAHNGYLWDLIKTDIIRYINYIRNNPEEIDFEYGYLEELE